MFKESDHNLYATLQGWETEEERKMERCTRKKGKFPIVPKKTIATATCRGHENDFRNIQHCKVEEKRSKLVATCLSDLC